MPTASPSILDSLSALADATRCRVLRLLESHELTVGELCGVLQLPQSTMSRHLKTLGDAGWVTSRRDVTSRFYSLAPEAPDDPQAQLWQLTRQQLDGRPAIDQEEPRVARRPLRAAASRFANRIWQQAGTRAVPSKRRRRYQKTASRPAFTNSPMAKSA